MMRYTKNIKDMKIVMVGSGAFGTAIANQFVKNSKNTWIYGVDASEIKDINENNKNSKYFSTKLSTKLTATLDPVVFNDADIIVIGLPSHVIETVIKKTVVPNLKKKALFINLSKGYDYINQLTLVDSIKKTVPRDKMIDVMKLSGPSFALDVVMNRITYLDLASKNKELSAKLARDLTTDSLKINPTDKVEVMELSSMLKNPLAIFMGIIDGLGYKENTRAAMFTVCVLEMQRIVSEFGFEANKVISPSGIGDFFLTGTSKKSRNYSTGFKLGKADKVTKKLLTTFATTEGLKVLENIMTVLKKRNIESELFETLYSITHNKKKPSVKLEQLLQNLNK